MAVSVPVAIDFVQWSSSCDFLVRLVQSNKRMKDDANPFSVTKVLLADRAVSIGKLERVEESECAEAPGTVLAIEENSWHVAAADGVVKISDFSDEYRHPISAQTVANQSKVTKGERLPVMTSEQVDRITKNYTHAMSAEPYWKQKLEKFERPQISFVRINEIRSPAWKSTAYQISNDYSAIEVLTAWLIYIARDAQMSKIQIGWDATESWHENNGVSTGFMFAKTVPFGTTIDLNDTFSGVVGSVKRDYNELVNHLPCLSDIATRHAAGSNSSGKQQWALAVSLIDTLNEDEHFATDASGLAPHAHGSLMTLQIGKKNGTFRWIYDQNQISEEEVSLISLRLLALLESARIKNEAEKPVTKLNLSPKAERDLLLYTWNQTNVAQRVNRCLHQIFEEQVKRDGRANAVEFNGQTISYAQLNAQSNRLAHYLIASGIKTNDLVTLCVERSITMVVAILAILKSGAAYVPIDPAYPSQRLNQILQDANSKFLLADATGRKVLGDHQVPVIELEQPLPADSPCDNPDAFKLGLTPRHLAYVIYTSGSTGQPKGVMVEHHAVAQLFKSVHEKFGINKGDKLCLFHSISYDISVWEMWAALMNGCQLSIVPQNIVLSPDDFYDWLCSKGITVLRQTPSVFKMLLRSKNISSRCDRLRYVIFGGEALDPVILREWYAKYDGKRTMLASLYGSTEAANNATCWIVDEKMSENGIVAIGRPLPTKRIYLLDAHGEPVPIGMEGEIYIGGDALARGYLNRPELNAERFISDPFSDDPAARMYRTGDRARYLPDGNLICVGRTDQQVKIRGIRIELGEIEAHLIRYPKVREAVVQLYGNGSDARVVAYVVTETDTSISQDLRSYLSTLLPDYMVPAAYVRLPCLPLTPNGKLDRRALPAPDYESFARQQYEAPQTEMEEKLAGIWRNLLNIERISRHDNFFALGGHSLLVVRLMAQLRQIGLDTTVREIFDAPSLATLAATLGHYHAVAIPPNLITTDSKEITPEMLPLISLSQAEINEIITQVPGGLANIQDIYGLAPFQSDMLFHHIKAVHGHPYLMMKRIRFTERVAVKSYVDALEQVISRHDIFRSIFIWEGLNKPAQVVLRRIPSILTEITLDDTEGPILEQLSHQFNPHHYRLELSQAPLLRLMAAPTSEGTWVAVQLMHHIIFDHLTLKILIAEVHAIIEGNIEKLATPTPFRYLVAQAQLGASCDEHKRFFTKMLGDIDEPTLPFGLSDVILDGTEMNHASLQLTQTINSQLREHAQKLHVSLASICHLAWAQVLARASGREAVVFGTVLLGRLQTGEGNNDVMGPAINILPIRIDIDEKSVEVAVRQAHAQLSSLLPHELASLALAQGCSGCTANVPLFSALLNYRHSQNREQVTASLPGVTVRGGEGRTNYPLIMSLDDNDAAMRLSLQVVSQIPAARMCGYMHRAMESLADALVQTPQAQLRSLEVIPTDERTLLLHTWNQTTATYSPVRCLHQLFETQVQRDGEATAVECDGEVLSYSKLNFQANRLAHYLIARGVKPDDRIALCVERNTKLIVSMLGILKAGGAYVPLDPKYPSQRLKNILEDSDPLCVLADLTGRLALGDHQVPIVDMDESLPVDLPIDNPSLTELGLTPSHLAYIIYTSGSTGTPKGVMVEHRNATNCLNWIIDAFTIEDFQHTSFSTSVNFDMSLYECFATLSMGTTLHVAKDPLALSKSSNISILSTVPSVATAMLNTDCLPTSLRAIHLIGEPLKASLIKRIFTQTQVSEVCNLYGQTETTFFTTLHRIKSSDDVIETIGRPIANTQIYLLDAHGEPVPLEAEGEIYIGGDSVARGYLNRSELTAERFLANPFSDNPEARMYRTGDRARYSPNGNLVYLGRTNQQVKIRGFRIETGEIESHLVDHPQVREAVVQPHGNGSDARLVAYVVTDSDKLLAHHLRTYLSTLVPYYMVPAAYVCLSSLPLMPNGKLDRQALPAPDDDAFTRQHYEAPQSGIEEKLAEIWRELLNIEHVSRYDSFFELGGHTLLVMQFINTAKRCHLHIDLRGVFSFPILKDLAAQITKRANRMYCDGPIPIRQYGNETPLFLLPEGLGGISYGFRLAQDIDKSIPVYMLPWPSPEDKQPSSMEEMAHAMISLMKRIQACGPYSIAGYSAGGILAYEMAKQLINTGHTVSFLGLIDTHPCLENRISQIEIETDTEINTETKLLLFHLLRTFPAFKSINDAEWWSNIIKLSPDQAIEEMKKTNIDLKNIDFEWEKLVSKQRHNYINISECIKFDPLPIKIHLFRATAPLKNSFNFPHLSNIFEKLMKTMEIFIKFPKLGWEYYNISTDLDVIAVDGDHLTMMTDPKNRSLLGKTLTRSILSSKKIATENFEFHEI